MPSDEEETLLKEYRTGFVALIGRPNVGKSTLINYLVGEKVAITSSVAQTTRNRLRAILTTASAQLILVDTPGIDQIAGNSTDDLASQTALNSDFILFVLDYY